MAYHKNRLVGQGSQQPNITQKAGGQGRLEKKLTTIKDLEYKRKMTRERTQRGRPSPKNARVTSVNKTKGKSSLKWEGTYIIEEIVRTGTYHLAYEDG